MSQEPILIDFASERARRVHDLNEKRLAQVRQAFEQAMPLKAPAKAKAKKKPKKR